MKTCIICAIDFSCNLFQGGRSGRALTCSQHCQKELEAKRKKENQKRRNEQARKWRAKNHKHVLKWSREYYAKHAKESAEYAKNWRRNNHEHFLKTQRAWCKNNRDVLYLKRRHYRKKNAKRLQQKETERTLTRIALKEVAIELGIIQPRSHDSRTPGKHVQEDSALLSLARTLQLLEKGKN